MGLLTDPALAVKERPFLADALLAALLVATAVSIGIVATPEASERAMDWFGWSLLIAANAAIAWRRIRPLDVAWFVLALTLPFWILDYAADDACGISLLVAIYSLAAHVDRPRSIRHGWLIVSIAMVVVVVGVLVPEEDLPWYAIPANGVVFATAWILGDNLSTRRAYTRELEEKAARSQARQEAEARRAVAEERSRIARELHDVVAHSMSVMVVQAGAAGRVIDNDPDRAAEALAAIEATGRESLSEMRRILGVLRGDDEGGELTPSPTLGDFSRLIRQCDEAGLPVDLLIDGEARRLPASLELSAYRIVQESLTNSLKHAGPARATVKLRYHEDALEVEIADNGRGAAAHLDGSGSGQGLLGMRERVEAFGGTLRTGPRPGGGYAVLALLPVPAIT
jgi:signal transduction histidine kinase